MTAKRAIYQAASMALLLMCISCAALPLVYHHTGARKDVSFEQVFRDLKEQRVIFIGEAHTSDTDHLVQLEVIRRLKEEGHGVSVALEMFTPNQQTSLARWVWGQLDEDQLKNIYYNGWDIPYRHYKEIFLYCRQNGIRLYGINAEASFIAQVAREGLGKVRKEDLRLLKYSTCAQNPDYARAIGMAGIKPPHGKGMSYLCDAQRFRDSVMAFNLSRIIKQDGNIIVVLLGSGHAIRQAVPAMLQKHSPGLPYTVLMPRDIRFLTGKMPGRKTADFTW